MVLISGDERFVIDGVTSFFNGPSFDVSLWIEEPIEFNNHTLPLAVRQRINNWVEDMGTIISSDPSTILTERVLDFLNKGDTQDIIFSMTKTLQFFMEHININMSEGKAKSFSTFILSQLKIKLQGTILEEV